MKIYFGNRVFGIANSKIDAYIFVAGVYFPYTPELQPYEWKRKVDELMADLSYTTDLMFPFNDWFDWDGGYGKLRVEI